MRVALILALSIFAAIGAQWLDVLIPEELKGRFTADTTLPILNVLATSLLSVATFSLGVMVSSNSSLANQTTPRIHRLLMEDKSTQTMLASFIGTFAYSLSSIILFRAGYYSEGAAVIAFVFTVLVVVIVIVSLVRWIHQLSRIGSVDYALERAESTARATLKSIRLYPRLGASPMPDDGPPATITHAVTVPESGYLQLIDIQELDDLATGSGSEIFIDVAPGDQLLSGQPMARTRGPVDKDKVADCFSFGSNRSYEQDPRYAIAALRETASKALSPGINDPGTALEVVARLERLLWDGLQTDPASDVPSYDQVFMADLPDSVLIETAFRDISRDGAGFVDVLLNVKFALISLKEQCDADAREAIDDLLIALKQHAEAGLSTPAEHERFESTKR